MRGVPPASRKPTALVLAVAVAVLGTIVFAGSANAASPIDVNNRPTGLAGQVNGEVPASSLVNVAPNCTTARAAGPSLWRLFTMAREVNIPLGAEQCYRPLSDQVKFANQANQPGNN